MTLWERVRRGLPVSAGCAERAAGELRGQLAAQQRRIDELERTLRETEERDCARWEHAEQTLSGLNRQLAELLETTASQRQELSPVLQELSTEILQVEQRLEGQIKESRKNTEHILHWRADRLEAIGIRRTPCAQLSFEVALAEHCNLRCAGCDHFAPIAEPEFADINEFSKDFQRLSQLFSGKAQEIHLLGGEPLLHPELVRFLTAARTCFPEAVIDITTNGVLLDQMDEFFWNTCREQRIVIRPTKYPIELDYDGLERLAAEHHVEYRYFGNTRDTLKTLCKYPLDVAGMQEPRRSFMLCYRANKCIYLQHGRLYTCTVAPTARHLSKRFGLAVAEDPEDSIDIYAARSAGEVFDFLARPIPFCKYCMPEKARYNLLWRPSEGVLSEWTL